MIPVEGTVGPCIRQKGEFGNWEKCTYLGSFFLNGEKG